MRKFYGMNYNSKKNINNNLKKNFNDLIKYKN